MEKIDHTRSLNGDTAKIRAAIFQHRAILPMPFQPGKIFLNLRGIDDEQKFGLADSIKN